MHRSGARFPQRIPCLEVIRKMPELQEAPNAALFCPRNT